MTADDLIRVEMIAIAAGLAVAVFWKLITGVIIMRGLLHNKITGEFSPSRLQLLLSTLLAAAFYVQAIVAAKDHALPVPDESILAVVGGSNLIHLGDKFWSFFKLVRSVRDRATRES
jgi:hypothetical protein